MIRRLIATLLAPQPLPKDLAWIQAKCFDGKKGYETARGKLLAELDGRRRSAAPDGARMVEEDNGIRQLPQIRPWCSIDQDDSLPLDSCRAGWMPATEGAGHSRHLLLCNEFYCR